MVCAETGSFCTYILFVRSCQFFTVWLYCFMRVRFIFTIRSLLRGCARRCRCSIHCLRCGFRTRLCLRFRIKKCCLCGFPCWLRFFFFVRRLVFAFPALFIVLSGFVLFCVAIILEDCAVFVDVFLTMSSNAPLRLSFRILFFFFVCELWECYLAFVLFTDCCVVWINVL